LRSEQEKTISWQTWLGRFGEQLYSLGILSNFTGSQIERKDAYIAQPESIANAAIGAIKAGQAAQKDLDNLLPTKSITWNTTPQQALVIISTKLQGNDAAIPGFKNVAQLELYIQGFFENKGDYHEQAEFLAGLRENKAAIEAFARKEGISFDQVYSKAAGWHWNRVNALGQDGFLRQTLEAEWQYVPVNARNGVLSRDEAAKRVLNSLYDESRGIEQANAFAVKTGQEELWNRHLDFDLSRMILRGESARYESLRKRFSEGRRSVADDLKTAYSLTSKENWGAAALANLVDFADANTESIDIDLAKAIERNFIASYVSAGTIDAVTARLQKMRLTPQEKSKAALEGIRTGGHQLKTVLSAWDLIKGSVEGKDLKLTAEKADYQSLADLKEGKGNTELKKYIDEPLLRAKFGESIRSWMGQGSETRLQSALGRNPGYVDSDLAAKVAVYVLDKMPKQGYQILDTILRTGEAEAQRAVLQTLSKQESDGKDRDELRFGLLANAESKVASADLEKAIASVYRTELQLETLIGLIKRKDILSPKDAEKEIARSIKKRGLTYNQLVAAAKDPEIKPLISNEAAEKVVKEKIRDLYSSHNMNASYGAKTADFLIDIGRMLPVSGEFISDADYLRIAKASALTETTELLLKHAGKRKQIVLDNIVTEDKAKPSYFLGLQTKGLIDEKELGASVAYLLRRKEDAYDHTIELVRSKDERLAKIRVSEEKVIAGNVNAEVLRLISAYEERKKGSRSWDVSAEKDLVPDLKRTVNVACTYFTEDTIKKCLQVSESKELAVEIMKKTRGEDSKSSAAALAYVMIDKVGTKDLTDLLQGEILTQAQFDSCAARWLYSENATYNAVTSVVKDKRFGNAVAKEQKKVQEIIGSRVAELTESYEAARKDYRNSNAQDSFETGLSRTIKETGAYFGEVTLDSAVGSALRFKTATTLAAMYTAQPENTFRSIARQFAGLEEKDAAIKFCLERASDLTQEGIAAKMLESMPKEKASELAYKHLQSAVYKTRTDVLTEFNAGFDSPKTVKQLLDLYSGVLNQTRREEFIAQYRIANPAAQKAAF
ncbi:MAG: hypothetical protein HGA85_06630, partial [Nanoarchaeota archaeon]|nr:hypothetical protein [Nanoarchaeota archaeon]